MITRVVLSPGVEIDDAWAARIADSFTASLQHSQKEIAALIREALLAIPLWGGSERVVNRAVDRIVRALGSSCLGHGFQYRSKGRWSLVVVSIYVRSFDSRLIVESVRIEGKALEDVVQRQGRPSLQRRLRPPSVVNHLEVSRHAFERFIQRAGLHKPADVVRLFKDRENLHCLTSLDLATLKEPGEARLPLNTPNGRCVLVVERDEPYAPLVAKTLLAPPFTDRQEQELEALRTKLLTS